VGKSFRMFDEGRRRRERGEDVIVGAVQPKIPADLEPLLGSVEIIPSRDAMDVPAILARHPQVCLVDGLAFDNPPGSRHDHRWQDVEELLAAGINVIGSVNLQYIDDQRETIERITGKHVTETLPRAFLNTADEIELVDGPGYSELREKALILAADVIDAGLQRYLKAHDIEPVSGTQERFLVYLTPHANAERMIASGRRNAARFHGELLIAYVKHPRLSVRDLDLLEKELKKAQEAGAHVHALEGDDPTETIVKFARTHFVTQIFVGQSTRQDWKTRWFGSPVNRLIRAAREMDVRVFPH
jgi:two-component system sensor histidine kinase KdpD